MVPYLCPYRWSVYWASACLGSKSESARLRVYVACIFNGLLIFFLLDLNCLLGHSVKNIGVRGNSSKIRSTVFRGHASLPVCH